MPELPEVETLVRTLRPVVVGRVIADVRAFRPRSVWGTSARRLARELTGQRIHSLTRRAKYLRFELKNGSVFLVHLGMTGRLFLSKARQIEPAKHDVAHIRLSNGTLVFHDPRKFGHLAFGEASLRELGPEPMGDEFTVEYFANQLAHSRSPIKVRLLDQQLVAGIGNIYASEVLWRARIDPRLACRKLGHRQIVALHTAVRETLRDAIRFGGGLMLDFGSSDKTDGFFYYGSGVRRDNPSEHFDVYDREDKPCHRCRRAIARVVLGGRGTFFCLRCQARA